MASCDGPDWLVQAIELVQNEFSVDTRRNATQQVITSVKESNVAIIAIVEALGPHLAGTDDTRRAQAVLLLAEVGLIRRYFLGVIRSA